MLNSNLLDVVALTEDVPQHGLRRGQVGMVVEVLGGDAFEVEFAGNQGRVAFQRRRGAGMSRESGYRPVVSGAMLSGLWIWLTTFLTAFRPRARLSTLSSSSRLAANPIK